VKKLAEEQVAYKVVLLGKPNVGKSSLLNLILKEERAIVTAQPGTTREPLSEKVRFYKETIQLTDTAGIRRKRGVKEQIETLMVKSSFAAVRDADIVLLLMDASEGLISDQELKLAFYVFEQGKALIILFNKNDLVTSQQQNDLNYSLSVYEYLLKKVETLKISCKSGKNIGRILPLIDEVWKKHSSEFPDIKLITLFKNVLERTPLYHKTKPLMIYSAKQVKAAPISILLHVNEPTWFGESQKTFLENCLRSEYDLKGAPVLFIIKKKTDL
jgi:GTP-binding protein